MKKLALDRVGFVWLLGRVTWACFMPSRAVKRRWEEIRRRESPGVKPDKPWPTR